MMSDLPEYDTEDSETKQPTNTAKPIKITEQNADDLLKKFNF